MGKCAKTWERAGNVQNMEASNPQNAAQLNLFSYHTFNELCQSLGY